MREEEIARKIYKAAVKYYAANHKLGPYKKEWTKTEIIILRIAQALHDFGKEKYNEAIEDASNHIDSLGPTTLEGWTGFSLAKKIRKLRKE